MIISKHALLAVILTASGLAGASAQAQDDFMESSENNAEINIDPLLQALNKAGISRMSTEGVVQVPVSSLNQIVKAAKTSGVAAEIVGTESGALKIKLLKDFVKPSLVDLRPDLFSPSGEKDDIEFLVGSGALEDAAGPRRS